MVYVNSPETQGASSSHSNFLTPEHVRHIEGRGLLNDWSRANCRSIGIDEATFRLGYTAKSAGILFEGDGLQIQYRPDKPWKVEGDGKRKAPKYRSPVGEYDAFLPKHPTQKDYWDPENIKKIAYQVDGHPCVGVTEGPFKSIAGCSIGLPTVGLLGVSMGLTSKNADPQGKRYLVPALEKLAKAGIGFIFEYDSDAIANDAVCWEQLKLASALKKFNVPVYSVTGLWEPGENGETKGMDDYIHRKGADSFKMDILSKAQRIEAWEQQFKSRESSDTKSKIPKADVIAREIAEDYRDKLAFNNDVSCWYRYEADAPGVWSRETDEFMESMVDGILTSKGIEGWGSHSYITNIVKRLRNLLFVRNWKEASPTQFMPFLNGVLALTTGELLPHSPGYKFTWCLPREHNPGAQDWSKIKCWLEGVTEGNEHLFNVLTAFCVATLRGYGHLQKFLHLIGIGGAGKGTFMTLLTDLVGVENTHSTNLGTWCTNRFEAAQAYRKRLVLFQDEDKGVKGLGPFKSLTGGDLLRAEEKMKKAFTFKFDGMVVVASNFPIFGSDNSSGMVRRAIPIPFKKVVASDKTRQLGKEFQSELAAFTNYLLSLDTDWVEQILRGVVEVPAIKLQIWENKIREDAIAGFLNDCLIQDPTATVSVGNSADDETSLYGAYATYCKQQGHALKAVKNFSPDLEELCRVTLRWAVEKKHTKLGRVFTGLRLRIRGADDHLPTLDFYLQERCENAGEGSGEGSVKDRVKDSNPCTESVCGEVKDKTFFSCEKANEYIIDDDKEIENFQANTMSNPSPLLETLQSEAFEVSSDPSPDASPDASPEPVTFNAGDRVEDVGSENQFRVVDSDAETTQLETLTGKRLPRRVLNRNLKLIESAGQQLSLGIDVSPDGWQERGH